VKQDRTYSVSNPTQGLRTSGKLEDCKNKSMHFFGPKSINPHGSPIVSMVLGKYVQVATSFMKSFDNVMRVIFDEETSQRAGQADKLHEYNSIIRWSSGVSSPNARFCSLHQDRPSDCPVSFGRARLHAPTKRANKLMDARLAQIAFHLCPIPKY